MGKEKCLGSSFTRVTQAFPATEANRWLQPTGQWNILKHPNNRSDMTDLNWTRPFFISLLRFPLIKHAQEPHLEKNKGFEIDSEGRGNDW